MRIFGRERETLLATVVCKTNGAQRNIIKYRVIYRRFSNENPFSGGRPNRWNERRCSVRFPCVLTIIFRTPVYNREEHSSRSCDIKRQFLWLLLRKHWEICNSIVRMCVIKFACFNWIPIFLQHRGSQHFFFFYLAEYPDAFTINYSVPTTVAPGSNFVVDPFIWFYCVILTTKKKRKKRNLNFQVNLNVLITIFKFNVRFVVYLVREHRYVVVLWRNLFSFANHYTNIERIYVVIFQTQREIHSRTTRRSDKWN